MPAEDQIIIEFAGVDASQQGLTDYLKRVEEELLSIGKNNPQFLKGAIQGIKETTAELGKQAIAAGEDKKKVDFLVGSLNNLAKGVAGGAAKQATAEFQKFGNSVTATAKESEKLTSQLRRLRDEIAKLPEGSARFTELSIEAAKLQDRIGDVGERIRVLSSDTFAIDAVVDGVRGLTAAFSIAQSATALFGKENEDVQKALLKVQAATGLLIGVQEISQQLTGQGAAKLAILKGANLAYAAATDLATLATRSFAGALGALGIVGLIASFAGIILSMIDFGDATDEATEALERQRQKAEELKKTNEALRESIDAIYSAKQEQQINKVIEAVTNGAELAGFQVQTLRGAIELLNKEVDDAALAGFVPTLIGDTRSPEEAMKEFVAEITKQIKTLENEIDKRSKNIQSDIDGIIRFTPNKKNEIREIIKEAFDLKGELPKVPVEIEPRLSPSGISLDVPESDKVKLGQKISALFQDDAVQQAALDSAQTIFDTIFTISNENRAREEQAELDTLHRKEQQELTSIQKRVDNGLLTAEQGKIREEALRLKFAEKEKAIKLRQFNAEKQAALAQAFINSALAATKIIAQLGVAAAPALIAQGVALAAQIAIIASQKPPAFKKGTRSAPGGMALVGEEGAELMHVPQGARIVPHAETMKVLSGHPDTDAILSRFNIPVTSAKVGSLRGELRDFDFNRFESIISRHSQKSEVHVDKNGVITIVSNGLNEREYYGNRYSFK